MLILYLAEMAMRNNTMVAGIPSAVTIPPSGLCLPSSEQMPIGASGTTQYLHLGFPSVNHIPPWTGQIMMGNQLMYHTGDMLAYPTSPLVSRQSSPSQSRSPSRSNSPMGRSKINGNPHTSSQITQSNSNTLMTSSSGFNNQTSIFGSNATNNNSNNSVPSLSTLGVSRSLPSQSVITSTRPVPLPITSPATFCQHNNVDDASSTIISTAQSKQALPSLRLRSSNSCDSLRETLCKEIPNFKGNLQNYPIDEVSENYCFLLILAYICNTKLITHMCEI